MRLNLPTRRGRADGFTLIEVLITIFITAIGLLTVAGLQAASKKVNFETAQRTSATALAQDMVERIRANPSAKVSYLTSDATAAASATGCAASSAACSSADLAAYDVYQWGQKLLGAEEQDASGNITGGLVNPTGCITYDATNKVYRVAVAWRGYTALAAIPSTVPSNDPMRATCGNGLGRYTDPLTSGSNDLLRRLIVVEFI
ncbi:MAG: putative type 4 fimbrial biosis pilv-related transrane protein [Hydrocarboniphaga sp.]|uniref:type IV pilus modification protein PilV n=1 Tax=Hydrocarboniphaga sp. TaxID=2033016 RepID=UPI00260507A6|nr:type IV pilus modification protein PilV [Hydrocarboniphaga sp.]MDB5968804.1 putative type 4 fimbrial biosis pilv-related transrane protein [Hydrocarboniphaga sp.]